MTTYDEFLETRANANSMDGFEPSALPEFLFDFQRALVDWAIRKGRAAIFADCGLGKTPMQLAWADAVVRKAGAVLIAAPLAVGQQIEAEAAKFGIEVARSKDGLLGAGITVTNYERLHLFDPENFAGMVCDESSILKNFEGSRKTAITEFMRRMRYRLLCTATAAPNDYIELGTSSEALGELGHMDMLARFFRNEQGTASHRAGGISTRFARVEPGRTWRFKGHAEMPFWRWVCSWARACRKPSDLGFDDGAFILPPLVERQHVVAPTRPADGMLFDLPAQGLHEQREERRRTIRERCEKVAALVNHKDQALVWCHLNEEGDLLEQLIPGAIQVAGSDSDDDKEERLVAFQHGEARVLVTKPKIGAWGLNLQGCAHVTTFPSHSYEQYYQGVRRCWRFGQERAVVVDTVTTPGDANVLANVQRKALNAERMFSLLVQQMNHAQRVRISTEFERHTEVPSWL